MSYPLCCHNNEDVYETNLIGLCACDVTGFKYFPLCGAGVFFLAKIKWAKGQSK